MSSVERCVLITGASSGIGLEAAGYLAGRGFRVFATVRATSDTTELDRLIARFGEKLSRVTMDVSDSDSVRAGVEKMLEKTSRIDVLVNNAAYVITGGCETVTEEEHKQLFETNYFGPVRVMNAVLPSMREQGSGRVINVSSVAGINPFPAIELYSASKFAIEGLTESMASTYKCLGIFFSLIQPGSVKTPAAEKQGEGSLSVVGLPAVYGKAGTELCRKNLAHGEDPIGVAKLIETVILAEEPHLRYQSGEFAKASAERRYNDPTGDQQVKTMADFLDSQKILAQEAAGVSS